MLLAKRHPSAHPRRLPARPGLLQALAAALLLLVALLRLRAAAAAAAASASAGLPAKAAAECRVTASGAPGCAARDLTVAFALIGRDVAHELPHVLSNVERLGAAFKRAHVLMVENDSADDTVGVFAAWAAAARAARPGWGALRAHSLPSRQGAKKDLGLLAKARNAYIELLQGEEFEDVDFIIPVDTDMCFPWDVALQAEVITNLLPSFAAEWHVLFANGVCGWYIQNDAAPGQLVPVPGNTTEVPPWGPGSVPVYCDLFALRDGAGAHHQSFDVFLIPGSCAAPSPRQLGCRVVGGEAVVPVQAAFGGWGMYWAGLFKPGAAGEQGCRYASTGSEPCEHVPLSRCLRERAGAKQVIASRLVVNWEGCTHERRRWDEGAHFSAAGYSYEGGLGAEPDLPAAGRRRVAAAAVGM